MITLWGVNFYVYGFLIGLAVVLAYSVMVKVAVDRGLDKNLPEKLIWWILVPAVIGARLYHVIDLWDRFYKTNLENVFYVWNGGLGIWGAIIGGAVGLFLFYKLKNNKYPILKLFDAIAVGVPLGQAVGRLGNFFNQELYGKISNLPWSIYIQETGKRHHPLFAYEAILNLFLFGLLWKNKKNRKDGWLSGVYLMGYSIIRLTLEPLRPEYIVWRISGVPTASLVGIFMFFLGIYLVFSSQRQS